MLVMKGSINLGWVCNCPGNISVSFEGINDS